VEPVLGNRERTSPAFRPFQGVHGQVVKRCAFNEGVDTLEGKYDILTTLVGNYQFFSFARINLENRMMKGALFRPQRLTLFVGPEKWLEQDQ
jgi:hypothetical protein